MKKLILTNLILSTLLLSCGQTKKEADTKPENEEPQVVNMVDEEPAPEVNSTYDVETVVGDMESPWGMVFLPDGSMLISEKRGDIILFKDGSKTLVKNVPEVVFRGQGGLLDLELHPNYEENGWIYISYSSPEGKEDGANTAIMRAKLKGDALVENEIIYKASPNTTGPHHFGSRIEFDNDGFLFFTMGEREERDINPQDITRDNGKVYRLKDDGTIPEDNPFVGKENAKEAIYTYGHRNPQGMLKHPETGEMWIHEHGPRGGDEINILKKGANYGWPVISYGINYNGTRFTDKTEMEDMEQPIYYWVPSIAPSGMIFVTSDKYPELKGSLLVGAMKFQYLEKLTFDANNKITSREKLLDQIGRVRNVRQGPNGNIYVGVDGKGIFKLVKK